MLLVYLIWLGPWKTFIILIFLFDLTPLPISFTIGCQKQTIQKVRPNWSLTLLWGSIYKILVTILRCFINFHFILTIYPLCNGQIPQNSYRCRLIENTERLTYPLTGRTKKVITMGSVKVNIVCNPLWRSSQFFSIQTGEGKEPLRKRVQPERVHPLKGGLEKYAVKSH